MELTRTPDVPVPPRRFLAADFDPADRAAFDAVVKSLLDRPVATPAELRRFIEDWGELGSAYWGEWARRLIAMNRDTRDKGLVQSYRDYQQGISPAWQRADDALSRKYLASKARGDLGAGFVVFDRKQENAAALFREENVELSTKAEEVGAGYQQVMGGITVEYRGKTLTREQCGALLQETDRAAREEAWRARADRMAEERDKIDGLLDEVVGLRHAMAKNAGFDSYADFRFRQMERFDYTPEDCRSYHAAAEKVVVPALRELRERRRKTLGLDALRPWDLEVSLVGAPPRDLFQDQADLETLLGRIFRAVDPVFAADFDILVRNGLLDLMTRPGKAPGGYNCPVEDIRLPFIFWNAVGRRGDLRVMLHEGGHAFHTLAVRNNPVLQYRHAPTEFSEVASMAMELLGFERLEGILDDDELREFTHQQFEGILGILAHVALVDAFQAWMYGNPKHTREERATKWRELSRRFQPGIDMAGLESYARIGWQRIPHLFTHPLYFIEYGIAQIGALQVWRSEKRDHAGAVKAYRKALALGGSRPLPELFEAAGIRFAMDEAILKDLVPDVLARIPNGG